MAYVWLSSGHFDPHELGSEIAEFYDGVQYMIHTYVCEFVRQDLLTRVGNSVLMTLQRIAWK